MDGVEVIHEESADVREPVPSRLALIPFHKIEIDTAPAYLVKGLIPCDGLTVVWGPPKCGKSFWIFDVSMHVALGWDYRGRHVKPGPVVYVACEGAHGFKTRVAAFRKRHLNGETPPFFLVPTRLDLIEEHDELVHQIDLTLRDTGPVAIVLDTLNRSLRGSENSDEDMSDYIKATDALREKFKCAVVIVHHCGTEGTRPRGHTSLPGAADAQLAIRRDASGLVTVTVERMKDGPEGDRIHSRLEAVKVGIDDNGDPVTSCVVVPVEETEKKTKPPTGHAKTAYEALIEVVDKRQTFAEGEHHHPESRTSAECPIGEWREEFKRRQVDGPDIKPDTLLKRFSRATDTLKQREIIGFYDGMAWINWDSRT